MKNHLVYSTDPSYLCQSCQKSKTQCQCNQLYEVSEDGWLRIQREKQGRAGKTVISIQGFGGSEASLKQRLALLKKACGSGGTIKEGVIEIQGDHLDKIMTLLQKEGHKVKKVGG